MIKYLAIALADARLLGRTINHWFNRVTPKGLYTRSLLIVMFPTLMLLSVTTYIFLERHWQLVTHQIAKSTAQDIAALIEIADVSPELKWALRAPANKMGLELDFLPASPLPQPSAKPFFDPLDKNLNYELGLMLKRPFWIDTVGRSNLIEVRVAVDNAVVRIFARRGYSYASSSWIFLAWLLSTSLVVLGISLLFLRNQIKPILSLSQAAQNFGKGREPPEDFKPRGAREVRAASLSFIEMKRRIERAIDQRTIMLAGVSHDLRTVLTRFKLELAFLPLSPEREAMEKDVVEMNKMVEAYLDFAKGEDGEVVRLTNIADLLADLKRDCERAGHETTLSFSGESMLTIRPHAFKRALTNLTENAARYGNKVGITGLRDKKYLTIYIDDDGIGIPEHKREEVFKPFLRLDEARNLDESGTGLGLAIARDIVRGAGGDITLDSSPMGGLRAAVRVPV